MEKQTFLKNALFALLGLILLFPSIVSWVLWINVFNANLDKTQAEKVTIYLTHFPSFFHSLNQLNLFIILSSAAALVISIISTIRGGKLSVQRDRMLFKNFGVITIILSALMTFMNLFQYM